MGVTAYRDEVGNLARWLNFLFLFQSPFALDGTKLLRKRIEFFNGQASEDLARNSLVLAEGIDTRPVGGINSQLMQQLKTKAAFLLLFIYETCQTLNSLTTGFILCPGHLSEAVGSVPGPLPHEFTLHIVPVTATWQQIERCVKACEIGYFLCHNYSPFDN